MHKGKYVFAQLLDFIDKDVFLRLANKYDGNRYAKQFTNWNQLAVLMFGQISNFLHVDKATSKDNKVLGYVRKRGPYSDLLCDHSLLYDGYSAEK